VLSHFLKQLEHELDHSAPSKYQAVDCMILRLGYRDNFYLVCAIKFEDRILVPQFKVLQC